MTGGRKIIVGAALLGLGYMAKAQITYSGSDDADAFLATGSAGNPAGSDLTDGNFGGAGILVVASAASVKGEFQSLLKFNLTNAIAQFNTSFGAGNWRVTAISLTLTSNYGTAGVQPNNAIFPVISGGKFVIEWLADNDWTEGTGTPHLPTTDGVTYDSLPELLAGAREILCTNTYLPPGNNVPVTYALPLTTNLLASVASGGEVTFLFFAADDQIGYLFNSYNYGRGNEPLIQITGTMNVAGPKFLAGCFTNGLFHLTAAGEKNATYQVQAGANLAANNWQTIGSATADGSGLIQFDDPANFPQRFYRLAH
jgi:hypothetical protein